MRRGLMDKGGDSFFVGLPLVTLEEVQQVDTTLREANAVFTYEIGIRKFPSFASLPLGSSTDELRVVAHLHEAGSQIPFVSICIRGDGIEALLHENSAMHRLWFANFKCLLFQRKAELAETSKAQEETEKHLPVKVWLICRPNLERLSTAEPGRGSSRMWFSTLLWKLLGPIVIAKLTPPGGLPSAAKQFAEASASFLTPKG
jgi:hypothetical protein